MKWTKTPPTEPGWYWVKWDSGGTMPPEIVRMTADSSRDLRFNRWWFSGNECESHQFEMDTYEFWPEPLLPPEETP